MYGLHGNTRDISSLLLPSLFAKQPGPGLQAHRLWLTHRGHPGVGQALQRGHKEPDAGQQVDEDQGCIGDHHQKQGPHIHEAQQTLAELAHQRQKYQPLQQHTSSRSHAAMQRDRRHINKVVGAQHCSMRWRQVVAPCFGANALEYGAINKLSCTGCPSKS